MEAKELRIGNLVFNENGQIVSIDATRIMFVQDNRVKYRPIPLSEEWLIRFGFNQDGDEYSKENFTIRLNRRDLVIEGFDYDYNGIMVSTEYFYVHDLQNLYFAIKRHELECN